MVVCTLDYPSFVFSYIWTSHYNAKHSPRVCVLVGLLERFQGFPAAGTRNVHIGQMLSLSCPLPARSGPLVSNEHASSSIT